MPTVRSMVLAMDGVTLDATGGIDHFTGLLVSDDGRIVQVFQHVLPFFFSVIFNHGGFLVFPLQFLDKPPSVHS